MTTTGMNSWTVHLSSHPWKGGMVFFEEEVLPLCAPNTHDAYDMGDADGNEIGVLCCRRCANLALVPQEMEETP